LGVALPNNDLDLAPYPRGTGFFVQHEGTIYVVTAGHVAKALEDAPFAIRLNDKNEKARIIKIDSAKWWYHPTDSSIDIALFPIEIPEWALISPWVPRWFMTEERRTTTNVGAGDLAYIVGMYFYVPGTKKNIPIVHTGHIAMMNEEEPIPTTDWRVANSAKAPSIHLNGYLVEAETFEGLSGSPVFVRRSVEGEGYGDVNEKTRLVAYGALWMMGLWHGAWYGDPAEAKKLPTTGRVPVGIGIVIPASKIIDVLETEELKQMRNDAKEFRDKGRAPEPQISAGQELTGDDILRAALNSAPAPRKTPKAKTAKRGRAGVNNK
jgi:hypothetical protein